MPALFLLRSWACHAAECAWQCACQDAWRLLETRCGWEQQKKVCGAHKSAHLLGCSRASSLRSSSVVAVSLACSNTNTSIRFVVFRTFVVERVVKKIHHLVVFSLTRLRTSTPELEGTNSCGTRTMSRRSVRFWEPQESSRCPSPPSICACLPCLEGIVSWAIALQLRSTTGPVGQLLAQTCWHWRGDQQRCQSEMEPIDVFVLRLLTVCWLSFFVFFYGRCRARFVAAEPLVQIISSKKHSKKHMRMSNRKNSIEFVFS